MSKPIVYPFCKKPEHLLDQEYKELTETCKSFHRFNDHDGHSQLLKNVIDNELAEIQHQVADRQEMEAKLTRLEKSAITMKNVAERKMVEAECKQLRAGLLEAKRRATSIEKNIVELQAISTQMAQSAQLAIVDNAMSLVLFCKSVRARLQAQSPRFIEPELYA